MTNTIHVVGSLNADHVVSVQRLAGRGETVLGGDLYLYPGGKGANQAAAVARLGAPVRMIGQVGNDTQGRFLLDHLRQAGVDTTAVGRAARPSGAALIQLLPNGDNSIVVAPGANSSLDAPAVHEGLRDLERGDFLLCQLESPIEAVHEALRIAQQRGATSILDPAPARRLRPELLKMVDILTPNESEAEVLLQSFRLEPRVAVRRLLELGPSTVILTLGGDGAWISEHGRARHIPACPVSAVDTTAAGDTFNAALAVALLEGRPFYNGACWATAAAAISVTRSGAQTSCPSRAEADAFFAEQIIQGRDRRAVPDCKSIKNV